MKKIFGYCLEKQTENSDVRSVCFSQTNIPMMIIDSIILLDVRISLLPTLVSSSLGSSTDIAKCRNHKNNNINTHERKSKTPTTLSRVSESAQEFGYSFLDVVFIYYYLFEPLPFSHLMRSRCFFPIYLVCVCGFESNVREKYLPFWATIDCCWHTIQCRFASLWA